MNVGLVLSKWGRRLGRSLMKRETAPNKAPETNRWNIVKGDLVEVVQGPQTGQRGKVLDVLRENNRVIIDGVNLRSRHVKSLMSGMPGKKVIKPASVHYSNVMLVDPTTNKPTKVSRRFLEDGTKVRVSKQSGQIIPKPDPLVNRKPRSIVMGAKDTEPKDVFSVTFADYEKYLPFIYDNLAKAVKK